MFIKIYFNDKPLFLCDNIDDVVEPYVHHDDAVFIDELDAHTVKAMIHEMELAKIHAGVFFHASLAELKKAFFKKFTLVQAAGGLVKNENDEILLMGDKLAEENYRWGSLDGRSRYYTRRGGLMREESWRAIEPGRVFDTVDVVDVDDPNKVVDRVIVKVEGQTMKHGTWTYYDPEWGTILKTEDYWIDKLKTDDVVVLDDNLKPIDFTGTKTKSDTTARKSLVKPKAILDYEKKNSKKKKIKVRDGSTGY